MEFIPNNIFLRIKLVVVIYCCAIVAFYIYYYGTKDILWLLIIVILILFLEIIYPIMAYKDVKRYSDRLTIDEYRTKPLPLAEAIHKKIGPPYFSTILLIIFIALIASQLGSASPLN